MDILITHADYLWTADGVLRAQDIAITGERIETVAESGTLVPGDRTRVIDARGCVVVPGWKNGHTHAAMTLLRGYGDDMPLQPWLQNRIWPAEAQLTADDIYWGTRLAAVEMIQSGTTFANDMYFFFPEAWRAFSDAGIRAAVGLAMFDFGSAETRRSAMREVDSLLETFSDSGPRVFPAVAPHSVYTCSPELLQWAARRSEELGLVFHIHMSETEQEVRDCEREHGVAPFRLLDRLGVLDRVAGRMVAAHGVWLDEDERAPAAEAGVTIVHNPASNMKLASGVLDWRVLREARIPMLLAPDGVASNNNLDMFDEMKLAALLQKVWTGDPTRLTAHEALRLAGGCESSAFARYGVSGAIQAGEAADLQLITLSAAKMTPVHNIESNLVYSADGSLVDTVIIGGEVVMEHRAVREEEAIRRRASQHAEQLVARARAAST
jgi:5-methylthioadenosine/S-adenosylhomocysteine deaminase